MDIYLKRNLDKTKRGLIKPEELSNLDLLKQTDWLCFYDEKKRLISWGYLGKQNKGAGWLLPDFKERPTVKTLETLFEKSFQKRQSLIKSDKTTAFRLFNGIGDGLGGFTCDLYEDVCVWSFYNETIFHFQDMLLESFLNAYITRFGNRPQAIVLKNRNQGAKVESEIIYGELEAESFLIKENDISYRVYPDEGLMTGIFLDQREVRNALKKHLGKNKRVLNTFSYTGAFSVAAYAGGATETTSVDLAKRSRSKTEEQFEANDFPLENQKIYVMDIFDYFSYGKKKGLTYDLIVLDPPSFARNKKKVFSVQKNYGDLIAGSLDLMEEGHLICSTNASNWTLKEFKKVIQETFKKKNRSYEIEEVYRLPEDFAHPKGDEEENYLKVLIIRVN